MLNFDLRIAHYSSEFHFGTAVLGTLRRSSLLREKAEFAQI